MSQPQSLGKYQIEGVLGKGAMGVVYKGFDPNIARQVAIKTIHASLLDTDMGRELLDRFRNEAQAVGRLNHANIVAIYEFDQDHGTPYFVMEYVEGHDLKTLLKEGREFSIEDTVHIIGAILNALQYTHNLGIVHRDIKPANVFITHEGEVKLADFGIARVDNAELTQMGSVLGTPSYMSPEQCKGKPVDARSDLFSTGVVLYELLVGKKPFGGDNTHAIMHSVLSADPVKPTSIKHTVPKAFDGILKKALSKDLDHRYQSAEVFLNELKNAAKVDAKPSMNKPLIAGVSLLVLVLAVSAGVWFKKQRQDQYAQPVVQEQPKDSEVVAKTERLMAVANAHFKVGRLVSPQGSNAFEAYQLVLQADPQHDGALDGIAKVKNRFFKRAQVLALEGRTEDVQKHLELAEALFPNDERVTLLRNRLTD